MLYKRRRQKIGRERQRSPWHPAVPTSLDSTYRINVKVAPCEARALSSSFESIDCEISWKSSTVTICYFFCRKNKAFHHMIWMTQDNMKCRKITSIIKIGKRFEDNRWQLRQVFGQKLQLKTGYKTHEWQWLQTLLCS